MVLLPREQNTFLGKKKKDSVHVKTHTRFMLTLYPFWFFLLFLGLADYHYGLVVTMGEVFIIIIIVIYIFNNLIP